MIHRLVVGNKTHAVVFPTTNLWIMKIYTKSSWVVFPTTNPWIIKIYTKSSWVVFPTTNLWIIKIYTKLEVEKWDKLKSWTKVQKEIEERLKNTQKYDDSMTLYYGPQVSNRKYNP
jgi:hypothetical protein